MSSSEELAEQFRPMVGSLRRIGVPKRQISLWHTGGIYRLVVVLERNNKESTHYLELSGKGGRVICASYNYKSGEKMYWIDVTPGNHEFREENDISHATSKEKLDEALRYSLTRALKLHESRRRGEQPT